MSLLDDIAAEKHEFLIAYGNLPAAKRALQQKPLKHVSPPLILQWQGIGYTARITRYSCACGNKFSMLDGLFYLERSLSNGGMRETRLSDKAQIQQQTLSRITTSASITYCLECLP